MTRAFVVGGLASHVYGTIAKRQAWLPDVRIPALEPALMRRWSKSAKGVVVDGRLVPDPDA